MEEVVSSILKFIDPLPHEVGVFLMAILVTVLRSIYYKQEETKLQLFIEGCICGLLAYAVASACEVMGYEGNLDVFLAAFIGFIGVKELRIFSIKLLNKYSNYNIPQKSKDEEK